ncbi:MAG: hypothetical protein ACFFDC_05840 [Promethearchaeota archaeon]
MEPFIICKVCGEKNSRVYSKCRECESPLPREWESSSLEHVFQNLKRCHFCNARIKEKAKYCHRCGQKQEHEETILLPRPKQTIDIEFSRDHRSLERAIQSFDAFFAKQSKQPGASEDIMFNQKKIWYFNQKERFLQRNISNEMFYNNLRSLQDYVKSMAIIPELLEPETDSRYETKRIKTEADYLEESPPIQEGELTEAKSQETLEILDLSVIDSFAEVPTQSTTSIIDDSKEISPETDSRSKPGSEEIHSLFSPIQYQVQNLIFEEGSVGPVVRIIPYSGSMKEITVTFNQICIIMEGCMKKLGLPLINLELKCEGEPRQLSWEDPWEAITVIGEKNILNRIKMRTEIADYLASLGTVDIKVKSESKGEIFIQLSCIKVDEVIKKAFTLIRDLQLFLEISTY